MSNPVASLYVATVRHSLSHGLRKIEHCLKQLESDEQVWWRPREGADGEMNSIANLMLHLAGNMRQWIIAPLTEAEDRRDRPGEFSDRSRRSKAEVLGILKRTIEECDAALAKVSAEELLQPRRIQGFDTTILAGIFDAVSHFRGHVQEIIHMTRVQLGGKYQYFFVPK